ncbi:MAG TPA: DUF1080 domain-containing protein [Bryobacteraceae bacterium]|nr:DUF1080 domain-containing protein [Bryobacteraceae bacterium]
MKRLASVLLFGVALFAQAPSALESEPQGWIEIMPAPSLQGWTRVPFLTTDPLNPVSQWKVDTAAGILICEGDKGHEFFRYDKELANFIFHAEWRFPPVPNGKGYNSGILVRTGADGVLWHQAQTTEPGGYLLGDTMVDGAKKRVSRRSEMKENRVKPIGEWNVYEVRAEGPKLKLWVNGAVVNEWDDPTMLKGYIGLEAEGFRVEFRNLKLKVLP